jgi:hypothetical protein
MVVNKGENIGLTLQLIKSDGVSVEETATVTYRIFDDTGTVEKVSEQTSIYNTTTKSYVDSLVPSASWTDQEVGSYLIVWSVSNTDDDFNDTYTEDLQIGVDADNLVRALGLSQENYYLDNTVYTEYQGAQLLTSGRVRIYSNAADVGTDNNVIETYQITSTWAGHKLDTYKVVK